MNEDKKWMNLAIKEAIKAQEKGEVPVGAIIVKNDILLAQSHNETISTNDATAHAEVQLIRAAGKKLKNYRLINSTVYVTLEPCAMCLGAMVHARITKIVYGAYDSKTGVCGSCGDLANSTFFKHRINIKGGVQENQCRKLLQDFFKTLR